MAAREECQWAVARASKSIFSRGERSSSPRIEAIQAILSSTPARGWFVRHHGDWNARLPQLREHPRRTRVRDGHQQSQCQNWFRRQVSYATDIRLFLNLAPIPINGVYGDNVVRQAERVDDLGCRAEKRLDHEQPERRERAMGHQIGATSASREAAGARQPSHLASPGGRSPKIQAVPFRAEFIGI